MTPLEMLEQRRQALLAKEQEVVNQLNLLRGMISENLFSINQVRALELAGTESPAVPETPTE